MPICVVPKGANENPVVICDHCGKPIARASDGFYQWGTSGKGPDVVYFLHKENCSAAFGESRQDDRYGFLDLELLFFYLANALKIDRKETEALASLYARMS